MVRQKSTADTAFPRKRRSAAGNKGHSLRRAVRSTGSQPSKTGIYTLGRLPSTWIPRADPAIGTTLLDVASLGDLEPVDMFGRVRPSYHSFRNAIRLVSGLLALGRNMGATEVTTDPNGAIRMTWGSRSRRAELVCPFEEGEPPYIYHSDALHYDIEENPSVEGLARWIDWTRQE